MFLKALATFQPASKTHGHSYSLSFSHPSSSHSTPQPPNQLFPSSNSNTSPVGQAQAQGVIFLTQSIVMATQIAYEKLKQNESYKVHRVLINKLDDLATDLRTTSNTPESTSRSGNTFSTPTTDLGEFVKAAVLGGSAKDGAPSLRYLWTGRPEEVGKKRREKEFLSEPEDGDKRDGKDRAGVGDKDVKSSEDEGELGRPWSGRMQRKIESWTAYVCLSSSRAIHD